MDISGFLGYVRCMARIYSRMVSESKSTPRVRRWAFDVESIAVAAGVEPGIVRNAIRRGGLDCESLRSVSRWVATQMLARVPDADPD